MSNRFESLDGLRGIAAILVAYVHFHMESRLLPSEIENSLYLMVDLFFVLSGFVLAHATSDYSRFRFKSFIGWRLKRLYPLHLVTLAVFVFLELLIYIFQASGYFDGERRAFTAPRPVEGILTHLLLIHASGFFPTHGWNGPSWSVSAELIANVVFFIVRKGAKLFDAGLAVIAIASALVIVEFSEDYMHTELDLSVFRAIYGIVVGYFLWRVWRSLRVIESNKVASVVQLAVAAGVVGYMFIAQKTSYSIFAPLVFSAFILSLILFDKGVIGLALSAKPFVYLGLISYSVYLVHPILITSFKYGQVLVFGDWVGKLDSGDRFSVYTAGSGAADISIIFGYLIMLVIVSTLSYKYVERK